MGFRQAYADYPDVIPQPPYYEDTGELIDEALERLLPVTGSPGVAGSKDDAETDVSRLPWYLQRQIYIGYFCHS